MAIPQTLSGAGRHASRHAIRAIAFWSIIGITAVPTEAAPSSPDSQSKAAAGTFTETPLWTEGFEGNWFLDWTVEAGTWEVGIPTSGPGAPFASSNVAATVLGGNYSEPVDSRLIRTTTFVVPAASENPRLRFWHWFSFSSLDNGEVQVSGDGGTTWITESVVYMTTGSGVWTRALIDLSAYAGQTVQIAFDFHAACFGSCGDVSTGWYIDEVTVVTGSLVFNNPDDFETGLGDWAAESGTWEVGAPIGGPGSCFSGLSCAGTALDGNYSEPLDSRLISPLYNVPAASENPRLRFWHWFSFSSLDNGEVQVSGDGGTTWITESVVYMTSGSGVWTRALIDLSAYAGQTVQIAFDFHAACFGSCGDVSSGWYVDDVEIDTGPFAFDNQEGFETGLGNWAAERGTWEVGTPSAGPTSCFSGTSCAGSVLSGNYQEPVDTRLVSAPFPVPPAGDDPTLQFWHWFSFSTLDFGEAQISNDGGLTWQLIPGLGPFENTSSGVWSPSSAPISTYSGQTVQIAFDFHAACFGSCGDVSTGWYIDDITIFCGGEACVLSVGTDDYATVPEQAVLHENYPNPFGHATTIRFELAASSDVRLTVVDLLGRTVRELASDTKPAGYYEVSFDGTTLPSGIYFYRLEARDYVETKRMVVVR